MYAKTRDNGLRERKQRRDHGVKEDAVLSKAYGGKPWRRLYGSPSSQDHNQSQTKDAKRKTMVGGEDCCGRWRAELARAAGEVKARSVQDTRG